VIVGGVTSPRVSEPCTWRTREPTLWRESIAPAIAPAILALGGGNYGVLYAVGGVCAVLGAFAILPVRRPVGHRDR
jgi:hypothetical protein